MITFAETASLEDANAMVEACRDALVRGGFSDAATQLRGQEVFSLQGLQTTVGFLRSMTLVPGEAADMCRYTLEMLEHCLTQNENKRLAS